MPEFCFRKHASRDYEQIAREILVEAAAEDAQFGEARGDELPEELTTRAGRRAWLREAQRRLDERRAADPKPVPRSRPARLKEAKNRLHEELWTECKANAAYEAYSARGVMKDGRRFRKPPTPYVPPATPAGKVNLVLADAATGTSTRWRRSSIAASRSSSRRTPGNASAPARAGRRPFAFMRRVVSTDHGSGLYARRQGMIEPVFGDTKFNRRIERFQRRGRGAVRSEWRLIAATHDLLKLWRHTSARHWRDPVPIES